MFKNCLSHLATFIKISQNLGFALQTELWCVCVCFDYFDLSLEFGLHMI